MRSTILGVYKLEGRLLHVLDKEKACRVDEGDVAASSR